MNPDFFDLLSIPSSDTRLNQSIQFYSSPHPRHLLLLQLKPSRIPKSLPQLIPMHSKHYYRRLRPNFFRLGLKRRSKNRSLNTSKNSRKNQSESIFQSSKNQVHDFESFASPISSNYHFSPKSSKKQGNIGEGLKKTHVKNKFSGFRARNESKINSSKTRSSHLVRKNLLGLFKKKSLKLFFSEFFSVSDSVDMACSGFLNYSQFCKLLSLLRFIRDSFYKSNEETELVLKAWKCLGGLEDGKVKVEELYLFLLVVLDSKAGVTLRNLKKDKKSMVSLPPMCQINLHDEFLKFYTNRTSPKEEKSQIDSEKPTEISVPEVFIEKPADNYSKILEQDEIVLNENLEDFSHPENTLKPKALHRISPRELAQTPNPQEKAHLSISSLCDTPKNSSFHESEIEKASVKSEISSDRSIGSFISKIQVRKIKVEMGEFKGEYDRCMSYKVIRENGEMECNEINRSSSYKFQLEKNNLMGDFHESSTLSNSKIWKHSPQKILFLGIRKSNKDERFEDKIKEDI